MEFKDFPEIDWTVLLGFKNVTLLVTYVVLRELDKFKHDRGRRRDRALSVTRRIADLTKRYGSEAAFREGVTLRLYHREIDRAKVRPPLDPESADDRILALVRDLREEETTPVVFVTDDSVAEAKARTLGLPVVAMPDELRLPMESSEQSREMSRLKERVAALESRLPEPTLFLRADGELVTRATFSVRIPRRPTAADVDAKINELQAHYRDVISSLRADKQQLGLASILYRRPTSDEVAMLQEEAARYLKDYRRHLIELHEWERVAGREVALHFVVSNGGSAPAEDARILLHFPDGIGVDGGPIPGPTAPNEPVPPSTRSTFGLLLTQPPIDMQSFLPLLRPPERIGPDPRIPRIRKGRSTEVHFGPETIMHGFQWEPSAVWMTVPEDGSLSELTIPFEIHAANLPIAAEGIITIFVDYTEVEPWSIGAERKQDVEG